MESGESRRPLSDDNACEQTLKMEKFSTGAALGIYVLTEEAKMARLTG
jgi:hypothetical protein